MQNALRTVMHQLNFEPKEDEIITWDGAEKIKLELKIDYSDWRGLDKNVCRISTNLYVDRSRWVLTDESYRRNRAYKYFPWARRYLDWNHMTVDGYFDLPILRKLFEKKDYRVFRSRSLFSEFADTTLQDQPVEFFDEYMSEQLPYLIGDFKKAMTELFGRC